MGIPPNWVSAGGCRFGDDWSLHYPLPEHHGPIHIHTADFRHRGGRLAFWNLLESCPARIPLIESRHKWTQILFIILNSKLEIWIFIQTKIYVNSKYRCYDGLTLYHKILCLELNML